MRLWVDALDSSGVKTGDGPVVTVTSASVTRVLDGAGSISIDAPLTDERARELLTNERRVRVWMEASGDVRELTTGIIREVRVQASSSGWTLSASGLDSLDELRRVNVLLNRQYDNVSTTSAATSLAALAGWTATVTDAVNNVSLRFDGLSVLKSLLTLAEGQGLHLRLGDATREIEIGAFGVSSGMTLINAAHLDESLYLNDSIALIERMSVNQSSEAVCNWVLPTGAGQGEAALTLARSTRSGISTTTGPDGKTLYYIKDDASIATYGSIQRVVAFKQIAPLANSSPSMINAANALYDTAYAWLQRNKDRLDSYKVTVRKVRQTIRPGDKVRLVYKGIADLDTGTHTYIDVNADMWVLKATERYGLEGGTLDLDLASVDRREEEAAAVVVGAIEQLELANLKPQTYPYWSENTWTDTIQGYNNESAVNYKPGIFKIEFDNAVTDIIRILARVKTYPPFTMTGVSDIDADGAQLYYFWTMYRGSVYPSGLRLFIDDVEYSSDFGGPWNTGINAAVDLDLDLTDVIRNLPSGFTGDHTITFKAEERSVADTRVSPSYPLAGGLACGVIELNLRVFGIAQAILPT